MQRNISLESAQNLLLDSAVPVTILRVPLLQAVGRVLGRNIIADQSIPHFQKSAMDGYAVVAEDTGAASAYHPVHLAVLEEIRAGFAARNKVSQGTSIKVMTGAPIPLGADAVVKWEEVVRQNNTITITQALKPKDNVVPKGNEVQKGHTIALKGTRITPPMIAVFASLGLSRISVFRKLKVAIFSTGDELLDLSCPLETGKIYNSSLYGLYAQCKALGTNPVNLGICPDLVEAIATRIEQSLEQADLVITTGGVSAGDYDVVKDSILSAGGRIIFQGVGIKPGAPMIVAVKQGKFIIGLSGNPAALVTFDLIVIPLVKKLMGIREVLPVQIQGIMVEPFTQSSPSRRFLRARLLQQKGQNLLKLNGSPAKGVLMSMIDCNALIDIPAGSGPIAAGQRVSGYLIGEVNPLNLAQD